ncbi:MAG: hypothetical protein IID28_07270 [Planctomycetes bacterium]|nr:hypothetical protein [Planctomycetota bacterium]
MPGGILANWLAWGAGAVTFLVAVAVLWWGLFGDRARGRRRCPRCWYDMSHAAGMTCPECGWAAPGERHFSRTRRRPVPALVAAIVASVCASYAIERADRQGWLALVPTRIVVLSLPVFGDAHGSLTTELSMRLAQGTLTDSQLRALTRRCLRGDHFARPVSPQWEEKYGALLQSCRGAVPEGSDLNEALLRLPARIELASNRAWPRGAPICLDLDVRDWWPGGTECRVLLRPGWNPSQPITVWRDAAPRPGTGQGRRNRQRPRSYPLVITDVPDLPRLEFDVVLERLLPGKDQQWQEFQTESISVELEFTGSLAETMQPSAHDQLQEAMKAVFKQGVVKWTGGRSPVRVRFDARQTYGIGAEDTVIGAAVDILRAGTLARRLEIWWPLAPTPTGRLGWVVTYEDEDLITGANADDELWQLHVRGDAAIALRAGTASSYWAGEFTVPLTVSEIETTAPRKYWWRERAE